MVAIEKRTSVLVVGGGPVGLATAVLLHRFGIPAIVVEKSSTTTDHPKSRGCFSRTMELFRQWGVEDAIRGRGLPVGSDIWVSAKSLVGEELGRTTPEPNVGHTPSWKSMVAQDAVEEELWPFWAIHRTSVFISRPRWSASTRAPGASGS